MRAATTLGFALLGSFIGERSASAGEPSELVRQFYAQPGLELQEAGRQHFVDPGRRVLELDAGIRQGGEEGCLDPALPFDDTDYDHAEVLNTLDLGEVALGEEATVVASFAAEGETRRVQWRLKNVGGAWKIADLHSMAKDWSLSRFGCE